MSALGVSLIDNIYRHDLTAVAKAVLSSEIGSQLALQTIGIGIAIYFGAKRETFTPGALFNELLLNPPTVAIGLGLIWSLAGLPTEGMVLTPVFGAIQKADQMLAGLVAILIGLSVRFVDIRLFAKTAALVVLLELFYEPFATFLASRYFSLPKFDTDVLVIMMSMPAAALNVAIAKRYGCDAELASNLTLTSIFCCIISVGFVVVLL